MALLVTALPLLVEAQATRFLGSVTAINGNTLTVKTDAGDARQVEVPASADLKRIEPGQKDLSTAAAMTFSELAVGDRVLVKLDPNATGGTPQAAQIIAVKAQALAQKQKKDEEDWQKRGIAGLVKSVDPSSGTIVLTTGAGPTVKTVNVTTTKATVLKRYAPGSVRFTDAQPAPLDSVHAGDQLRARGDKSADGSGIAAEEVVSGTFRNVAGTIASIDTGASTIVVKDLSSKKMVTIHITSDAQMRRIPDQMARMLAARLNGASAGGGNGALRARPAGATGPGGPGGGGAGGGDPQRFLSFAPAIKLADLQKGEAVMVVSTDGATDVNAITLLAGVEPLLEAPSASNLLSNWSMGGGGAEAAAGTQ